MTTTLPMKAPAHLLTTTTANVRREVNIARASAPTVNRLARLRRWRWDITTYRAVDGAHPGVLDTRSHMFGECGYTFTWLGAAIAAARKATRRG